MQPLRYCARIVWSCKIRFQAARQLSPEKLHHLQWGQQILAAACWRDCCATGPFTYHPAAWQEHSRMINGKSQLERSRVACWGGEICFCMCFQVSSHRLFTRSSANATCASNPWAACSAQNEGDVSSSLLRIRWLHWTHDPTQSWMRTRRPAAGGKTRACNITVIDADG